MFFYKGIRIRKLHLHEYFLWQFLFFLPFLIGLGAYGYFSIYPLVMNELEKGSISDWQVFLLPVSISVSLLCLGLVFVFLFSRFLNSRENSLFTRASQRKQLANMIVQQKFYFEKKNKKGTKIKFHKIYYRKRKGNIISVYFPLDGNKDQKKFVDMGGQLEGMFFGDHMGTISHKGFLEYQIFTNVLESRISVREVVGKKNTIRYGKGLEWDFNSFPHLLISGGTGGGKSFALLSLMLGMLQVGEVEICDPKESDLMALGRLPVFEGKVFTGKGIIGCMRRGQEEMVRRFRFMQESSNFRMGKNYAHYGLKPKFIVIDEWAAFIKEIEHMKDGKELRREVYGYLTQLILKARQAGVFVILGMQRPDTAYLEGALRDNFMYRMSVGDLSSDGYNMIFGEMNRGKQFKSNETRGHGYVGEGGGFAHEMYTPFVPQEFDFYEEFAKFGKQEIFDMNVVQLSGEESKQVLEEMKVA